MVMMARVCARARETNRDGKRSSDEIPSSGLADRNCKSRESRIQPAVKKRCALKRWQSRNEHVAKYAARCEDVRWIILSDLRTRLPRGRVEQGEGAEEGAFHAPTLAHFACHACAVRTICLLISTNLRNKANPLDDPSPGATIGLLPSCRRMQMRGRPGLSRTRSFRR